MINPSSETQEALVQYPPRILGKFKTLQDVQAHPDGCVLLHGDFGGDPYVLCRASDIRCSEATLSQLVFDIDTIEWGGPDWPPEDVPNDGEYEKPWEIYYLIRPPDAEIWKNFDPKYTQEGIWVNETLTRKELDQRIRKVIQGELPRFLPERLLRAFTKGAKKLSDVEKMETAPPDSSRYNRR